MTALAGPNDLDASVTSVELTANTSLQCDGDSISPLAPVSAYLEVSGHSSMPTRQQQHFSVIGGARRVPIGISQEAHPGQRQPAASFEFLRLPAELRDAVYEIEARCRPAVLEASRNGKLASESGLWAACRQTKEEYQDIVCQHASIAVAVVDFDFVHLITFLESLKEDTLAMLSAPSNRQLLIKLKISSACERNSAGLHAWLDRFGHPEMRGTGVPFDYRARGFGLARFDFRVRPPAPLYPGISPVFKALRAELDSETEGRRQQELEKIVLALAEADENRKLRPIPCTACPTRQHGEDDDESSDAFWTPR
ncbi:hypothetical protein LTR37_017090 [Vermiconidia calcicola]|uniref:Uncharacterized protein n=1 Tax=Vermiconidia calcicola TaxID=1690605 RepID=A0ACC3MMJ4_9PEZI|nr:hypothetical protein LTR37_017090 [Vermiconidia calcicola]